MASVETPPPRRRVSRRDAGIIDLARRETDPAHVDEFQPIARGPAIALVGLLALALVVPPYMVWQRLTGWCRDRVEP